MTHKAHWKQLAVCVAIPLAAGGLSALLTRDSMSLFERLHQPPLAPPEWLFPIVWTVLFILMGDCLLPDSSRRRVRWGAKAGAAAVRFPAGLQFPVARSFFQFQMVPARPDLAGGALGAYSFHRRPVLPPSEGGRPSSGAVPALGRLRRISEPWHLSAQPLNASHPIAAGDAPAFFVQTGTGLSMYFMTCLLYTEFRKNTSGGAS